MSSITQSLKKGLSQIGLLNWLIRFHQWRLSLSADRPPKRDKDGVPVPTAYLITVVVGPVGWKSFLKTGEAHLRAFADAVDRNGGDFRNAGRVLDFGCGCGRLARHLPKLTNAEVYGVDYNPQLAGWCAENLPGRFSPNALTPPLEFPDGHFDVVYLLSVFTHLRIETQNEWLQELNRVVSPGGYAIVTFHDEDHESIERVGLTSEVLKESQTHIHNDVSEGSNLISSFQSRAFVNEQFSRCFEICEIVTSVDSPVDQAIAVLRKKKD